MTTTVLSRASAPQGDAAQVRPPSIDSLLRTSQGQELLAAYGHTAVKESLRGQARLVRCVEATTQDDLASTILGAARDALLERLKPRLQRVLNLTGTVLHTNLGRGLMSPRAAERAAQAAVHPCNLEFDLARGKRGERDHLIEERLCRLTGAEAATVVNNNAAAVLLMTAALSARREVVISRGELIEIGGAFRIPEVIRSANARLKEVGTTNRTHVRDYVEAVGPRTGAFMKVHTSNYRIEGFVHSVPERELADLAHANGLPLLVDLGSGSLVDLRQWGLPYERMVSESIADGADVVSFSGDKLLGGPQAGLIVGRRDLIERIRKHPLKRALRVCKMTLAALEETLAAHERPELLQQEILSLALLTRSVTELEGCARRLAPVMQAWLGAQWTVSVIACQSQIGSGSHPTDRLPSAGLAVRRATGKPGQKIEWLAGELRQLAVPVVARIEDAALILDVRTLDDEATFCAQFGGPARNASHP